MTTLVLIVGLAALVAGLHLYLRRQLARLANGRDEDSFQTFATACAALHADPLVVSASYNALQDHLNGEFRSFPLRVSDRLYTDLRIDPDDLDTDLVPGIARSTGRSMRQARESDRPVETVGELVAYISAFPRVAGERGAAADEARLPLGFRGLRS